MELDKLKELWKKYKSGEELTAQEMNDLFKVHISEIGKAASEVRYDEQEASEELEAYKQDGSTKK